VTLPPAPRGRGPPAHRGLTAVPYIPYPETGETVTNINDEISAYRAAFGSRCSPAIEAELKLAEREGRQPRIRLSEDEALRLDEARRSIAAMDGVIARAIEREREAGVFEPGGAGTERPEDPGLLTPEQEAAAVRVLLGEEDAPTVKLSPEDEAAALRLSEGV